MKILFIIDPIEKLKKETDSSLLMMNECIERKHDVYYCTLSDIELYNGEIISTLTNYLTFELCTINLNTLDTIVLRSNPPLNFTALDYLDTLSDTVFISNSINGLRSCYNKVFVATFNKSKITPNTYISNSITNLTKFIENSNTEKVILKPLDGYGGKGVVCINKKDTNNIKPILELYLEFSENIIAQEFIEGAEKGDVRVILVNGEPLGAMRRVPALNDIRSNVSAGGTVEGYKLTEKELHICKIISEELKKKGLHFVGIDIIGDKLVEINVISPGGIPYINNTSNINIEKNYIDFLESEVLKIKNHSN